MLPVKQKLAASAAIMNQPEMKRKKIHFHKLESQNYLKLGSFNHKLTVRAGNFKQRYLALLQNRERQQQKTLLLET